MNVTDAAKQLVKRGLSLHQQANNSCRLDTKYSVPWIAHEDKQWPTNVLDSSETIEDLNTICYCLGTRSDRFL